MAASLEERERLYKDIEARLGGQHTQQDDYVQEMEQQLAQMSAQIQDVQSMQLKYRCARAHRACACAAGRDCGLAANRSAFRPRCVCRLHSFNPSAAQPSSPLCILFSLGMVKCTSS